MLWILCYAFGIIFAFFGLLFFTTDHTFGIVCLCIALLLFFSGHKIHIRRKEEKELEKMRAAQASYQEEDDDDSSSIIGAILLFIITLPFKLLFGWLFKPTKYEDTAAGKWEQEQRNYYANDTARYQAQKRQKEALLSQARDLDNQARYGSDYKRRQLKKQADELRHQAGRL